MLGTLRCDDPLAASYLRLIRIRLNRCVEVIEVFDEIGDSEIIHFEGLGHVVDTPFGSLRLISLVIIDLWVFGKLGVAATIENQRDQVEKEV